MGGLTPHTSLSQACIPPPKEGNPLGIRSGRLLTPRGKTQEGNPFGGGSRAILPRWPPLILGLLGFARSTSRSLPILTDLYRLSWESILSHSRVTFTYDYLFTCMFFFRNRPLEGSPHRSCRALRGEVDSSIPRVSGGL